MSRIEKLLESCSRERRFAESAYEIHSSKEQTITFPEAEQHKRLLTLPRSKPFLTFNEREWQLMEQEIRAAKYILAIQNDLESDDFVPYAKKTLDRATNFLQRLTIHAHSANVIGLGVPQIGPADGGSIDLFWKKDDRTLLINFPAREEVANFYGRKSKSEISGRFELSESMAALVFWLTEQ